MSDIKLFRLDGNDVREIDGQSVAVEKSLQSLIERHLGTFLGVRFLATEYPTGKKYKGRIDTLGIDENNCPTIIEYKRATDQNVINQGLFYLDWLLDHKAEFKQLVIEKLGKNDADDIEWAGPRLICIAGDFTRYDEYAIQQINRNIELMRYCHYGADLFLLDLVNTVTGTTSEGDGPPSPGTVKSPKVISETLAQLAGELKDRFETVRAFLQALGDDVQMRTLKRYIAFKRIKNFACVEIRIREKTLLIYASLNPSALTLQRGFTRDVSEVGHYGTGNLEIRVRSMADFEKAKPLLVQAYEGS